MSDDQVRDVGELAADEGSKLTFGKFVALLALVAFVVFILQNTADTTVTFLGWSFTLSLWLVGVILFVSGALVGYVAKMRRVRRAQKAYRQA